MEIRQYKHGEGDFWQRMGPFLASAAVRRELGAPITSDETTTWWLAVDGDRTLGFVSARLRGGTWEFRHDYVTPEVRGQGVYRALFRARLDACAQTGGIAKATVNARSLPLYQEHGFEPVAQRGQYTIVQKELTVHDPVR